MSALISEIVIGRKEYPLTKPYILSFATLEVFVSIQVTINTSTGKSSTAEVVPLLGYSEESEDSILDYLNRTAPSLVGMNLEEARVKVSADLISKPFATSPILTAIDLIGYKLTTEELSPSQFVIPTSTKDPKDLLAKATLCLDQGLTLKIKLSGEPETDLDGLLLLRDHDMIGVRLDANQAYNFNGACQLITGLLNEQQDAKYDYLEQPFATDDWDNHFVLNRLHPEIPVMLDESVVVEPDLDRAIQGGIRFVKLKLFKQGGINELEELAIKAYKNGLNVVLGNGVATSLSNVVENHCYQSKRELFYGASEANGYLKVAN